MNDLTPYGIKDPIKVMDNLYQLGQDAIVNIIQTSAAPQERKQLRTWGINAVAELLNKSPNTIRALEKKENFPQPHKDENGRKQYTLELINHIRKSSNSLFIRPIKSSPIVLPILNFKGGVGKSMTSLLLMQYLAIQGLKILAVDLDPQATLTTWLGFIPDIDLISDDTLATTLLEKEDDIYRVIQKTYFTGVDIIPANLELQNVELNLPLLTEEKITQLEWSC